VVEIGCSIYYAGTIFASGLGYCGLTA